MKILYIPLDERPCNYKYPQYLLENRTDIDLIVPPKHLLGSKKTPALVDGLWSFIFENIINVDGAILSLDMLLYGGLIPSRLHHLSKQALEKRLHNIRHLKELNPNVTLYVSQCIMRCPSYDSSEEEPEYYDTYGKALFTRQVLRDKKQRNLISQEELIELESLTIPKEILEDYELRRSLNLEMNLKSLDLVKEDIIDFMVIPQDDSYPYGYTALAQTKVIHYLTKLNLEHKVSIYPGADEVGCSLLARYYNVSQHKDLKVFVFYASTFGPTLIPLYEDRPLAETLKSHLQVTHSYQVYDPKEADYILAINTPGIQMEEAFNQEEASITYTTHRNLNYFVEEIERYINEGYKVAICDSAYSNGSDLKLIKYLDQKKLWSKIIGYAGWNTNGNTLGTVLSMSSFNLEADPNVYINHIILRMLEDGFYQAFIRKETVLNYLPSLNLSYYDFGDKEDLVETYVAQNLKNIYKTMNISKHYPLNILQVNFPWHRMFEIDLLISVTI